MCGSATHPGGGIMGAPGRNAALKSWKSSGEVTDVIFVGGGHNGLAAAAVLARRGVKTLVLEARATASAAPPSPTSCIPGFRISTLAHAAQPAAQLMTELRLADHGLELIEPDPYLFAPLPDGRSLVLGRDVDATANSIATFSAEDARRYPEFCATLARVRAFAGDVMANTPPDIEQPSNADLWSMLMMGRRFRGLGKKDAYRLLRWAPMSAADFVSEWFESEPLRAAIAAGGIFGTALGPRSAGSAAVLLMRMCCGRWPAAARARRAGIADCGARLGGSRGRRGDPHETPKCAGST